MQTDSFNNFKVPVPPIKEQKSIALFLNKKIEEIENLIRNKEYQLSMLNQYKKSLIYEYVTGKKEVK
ncbi:MAG: restriction endonuclease subunit S [Coprobacillus sp.]|nr:restriction endonuclease subunit S [Coprobacillus sp.]